MARRAKPFEFPKRAMPLALFSQERRFEIWEQVMRPRPPPKWIRIIGGAITSRGYYEWHWRRGVDPDKRRLPIPKSVRERVLRRDGLVCQICRGTVGPRDVHLDHVVPFSKGGPNVVSNLRVTHSVCNIRRGNRSNT